MAEKSQVPSRHPTTGPGARGDHGKLEPSAVGLIVLPCRCSPPPPSSPPPAPTPQTRSQTPILLKQREAQNQSSLGSSPYGQITIRAQRIRFPGSPLSLAGWTEGYEEGEGHSDNDRPTSPSSVTLPVLMVPQMLDWQIEPKPLSFPGKGSAAVPS